MRRAGPLLLMICDYQSNIQSIVYINMPAFSGFYKRQDESPALYLVASSLQASASGRCVYELEGNLGTTFSHQKPEIRFTQPFLPDYSDSLCIRHLKINHDEVAVDGIRNSHEAGVHVIRKAGDTELAILL